MEYVALATLVFIIGFLLWFIRDQKLHFTAVEKDLLNRIQCRDYAQLVQGDIAHKQFERALTAEEIAELQAERGIPV